MEVALGNNSALPFNNMTAESLEPTKVATYTGAAVMIVFFVLGLLGNLLIMFAIITNRRVWNVINTFIISLVINDLLTYFLVVVHIIASYVAHGWTMGDVMCALNPELTVLFTGCSLWHTALIAIHRYIVVCHNNVYKRMSKETYVVFVLIMARAIPMVCVFPGFSLQSSGYESKLLRCILLPTQRMRLGIITFILILLPCVIVVLCYAFVFGFVWRIARRMQSSNSILKREVQITKMFGMVFFMILLGFVPYTVIRNLDKDKSIDAFWYVIVTVVYAIASCSNPLVYGAMSTEIRRACSSAIDRFVQCLHCDACFSCVKPVHTYVDGTCIISSDLPKSIRQTSQSSTCQKYTFTAATEGERDKNGDYLDNGVDSSKLNGSNFKASDANDSSTESVMGQDTIIEFDSNEKRKTSLSKNDASADDML